MKKRLLILLVFMIGFSTFFVNLGTFFDISEKPLKSDLIVVLGGNNVLRTEAAYTLYSQSFSKSNKLLLTGPEQTSHKKPYGARADFLIQHHVDPKNILIVQSTENTYEEIRFLKHYMLKHGYKQALIVTDPPHSRRIHFVSDTVCKYKQAGLKLNIVGIKLPWWDKDHYYFDETAIKYVLSESFKSLFYGMKFILGTLDE